MIQTPDSSSHITEILQTLDCCYQICLFVNLPRLVSDRNTLQKQMSVWHQRAALARKKNHTNSVPSLKDMLLSLRLFSS